MKVSKLKVQDISLNLIDEPGGVIRLAIDPEGIEELAENIREVGLLQPIMVRVAGERFEVVAGHRRLLAFKFLGREKIPAIVRDVDDIQCALARASENLRRVDLSPIEEAAIYAELRDTHKLTMAEIGQRMGKSYPTVRHRLDLLRMPPQLQKAVHKNQISYGVAEILWQIGDLDGILYYLHPAILNGVTVEVAKRWVKEWKDQKRRARADVGTGGGLLSPMEPRPTYVPCDLCLGPMELGTEKVFRCCPGCVELIRKSLPAPGG